MPELTDFRVLTFDCYGTLIDWETGIWDALQPLVMHNPGANPGRDEALIAFGQCESLQEQETPDLLYPELLSRVHRRIADRFDLRSSPELDHDFGASVPAWPAFADTAEALRLLKRHFRLVILSNVDSAGIAGSNRKLGVEFDAIYTAEDIGSYKPADANFEYLLSHLADDFGLERSDVLHTAQSLHHDHVPASRFGLANAWIDRQRLSAGGSWGATERVVDTPTTDFTFFSMAEMAAAVAESADHQPPRRP